MKVFSPSSTKQYLTCPMLWFLSHQGILPKTFTKGNIYAIRGSAVSAGLDHYNKTGLFDPGVVAQSVYIDWHRARIDDREWQEFKSTPFNQDEITSQAQRLVETYTRVTPPFEVLHSEYAFPEHGNARADVIARLPGNKVIPVDYKVKDIPLTSFYQYSIKEDFRYAGQLYHYVWAVQEVFNPSCLEFGIVILWYDKKCRIEYTPFHVNPERLANWLISARETWAEMEACEKGEKFIKESVEHRTVYGNCEYKRFCLQHNRNEHLAYKDYFFNEKR